MNFSLFRAGLAAVGCLMLGLGPMRAADPAPLRIGMELSYPPFEMKDANGNPTGVEVDMAQALAAKLGRPVDIQNIEFSGLIAALKTGQIDLIMSSMTANPERARSIDFSDPYVRTGIAILASAKSPVQSVADLNDPARTVAVKSGTTGHQYALSHLPKANLLVFDTDSACALEVAQGKADAFVYDQISILKNAEKYPGVTRPLLQSIQDETWAIGIRKGNDALRLQVNDFLKEFRAEKGFERLSDKYLKEVKQAFEQRHVPFIF